MTLPHERSRAVVLARQFLLRLADRSIKRVPLAVRKEALRILRHYPQDYEMQEAGKEAPRLFGHENLLGATLLLACLGCGNAEQQRQYEIRLVRPDGEMHSMSIVHAPRRPRVWRWRNGMTECSGVAAPVGWLLEVRDMQ